MSRLEMTRRGWDRCDIILVTGDAYVDHPSFGVALIGRWLESRGYRVGIIAAPDPNDVEAFRILGPPRNGGQGPRQLHRVHRLIHPRR